MPLPVVDLQHSMIHGQSVWKSIACLQNHAFAMFTSPSSAWSAWLTGPLGSRDSSVSDHGAACTGSVMWGESGVCPRLYSQ